MQLRELERRPGQTLLWPVGSPDHSRESDLTLAEKGSRRNPFWESWMNTHSHKLTLSLFLHRETNKNP
jgi:hypothetical protein